MNNQHDNFSRQAKAHDSWLSTNLEEEKAAARESAIENKSIEIYGEILSDPAMMAEALRETQCNDEYQYQAFVQSLCDVLRGDIEGWAYNYTRDLREKAGECFMDYAVKQAESWFEEL